MKTIALALSVAALFASAVASAQESTEYAGYTGFVSTKTRTQVLDELRQARQNGEVRDGEQYPWPVAEAAGPGKTRGEVRAETLAAIERGEVRYGEQYPDFQSNVAPQQSKTRAEVKAELAAYRKTYPAVSDDIDVASSN
jgi:hypothetical protein